MRRFFLYMSLPILAAGALASCDEKEPEKPAAATSIILSADTLAIGAEGGQLSVSYTIKEAVDDAVVQASPEEGADWLNDFDASMEGVISFTVSENPEEIAREAAVSVTYADSKANLTVIQDAAEKEDAPFDIRLSGIAQDSVLISITPLDPGTSYIFGVIATSQVNTFPDDNLLITEGLIPYYTQLAAQYGMSLTEYLQKTLLRGEQSGSVTGLSADTEYTAFCFGLTPEAEVTTQMVRSDFTTLPLGDFNAVIDVTVEGPDAIVKVTPEDAETGYLSTVFNGRELDPETLSSSLQPAVESMINAMIMQMFGMIDRATAVSMISQHGEQSLSYSLNPESDYTAAAFAINANGTVVTSAVIKEFTTGSVALSDNIISLEYTSVGGRKIEFTVTPSNEDPYVFFTYQHTEQFRNMSDDEVIDYILDNQSIPSYTRRGQVSSSQQDLKPHTEYVTYAFGVSGNEATTELFKFTVTTTEAVKNSSTFSYASLKYFNGDEAAALYPDALSSAAGKAMLPATYQVEGEWYGIWHGIFAGDLTQTYTEEELYAGTKNSGHTWMDNTVIYTLDYNETYTAVGFVKTRDGNYSELYTEVFHISEDGCSPIDEFDTSILEGLSASNRQASAAPAFRTAAGEERTAAATGTADKVPMQGQSSAVPVQKETAGNSNCLTVHTLE